MRLTRPLASAAVASSLVLAMSACGPDESDETSGQPVNRPRAPSDVPPAGQQVHTRDFATLIAHAFGKGLTAAESTPLTRNRDAPRAEATVRETVNTSRLDAAFAVPVSNQ